MGFYKPFKLQKTIVSFLIDWEKEEVLFLLFHEANSILGIPFYLKQIFAPNEIYLDSLRI